MLNGADVARSGLNVQTQHETSSDISFVQVCDDLNVEWANAQLNFVCIIHGLERGRGGVVEGILISHPALFSSLSRIPFFFPKIHKLKRSNCCKSE